MNKTSLLKILKRVKLAYFSTHPASNCISVVQVLIKKFLANWKIHYAPTSKYLIYTIFLPCKREQQFSPMWIQKSKKLPNCQRNGAGKPMKSHYKTNWFNTDDSIRRYSFYIRCEFEKRRKTYHNENARLMYYVLAICIRWTRKPVFLSDE